MKAFNGYHQWSQEELDYLRLVYPANGRKKSAELINARFGLKVTPSAVKGQAGKIGVHSNNDGKFKKGQTAYNKGIPMTPDQYEKHKNAFIKKGSRGLTWVPAGSESVYDGYVYVKLEDGRWVPKNQFIYEQAHGEIPEGYVVMFKDQNRLNFSLDNLILVERCIMARLSRKSLYTDDSDFNMAAINLCKLERRLKSYE